MTVDAIVKQVEELTPDQRAELLDRLHELYGEPDPDAPIELSDEMKALLDERNAAYEANPDAGYTREEVMEHLRRKR
jgi:putative addiction module component (TIGR02574 family)